MPAQSFQPNCGATVGKTVAVSPSAASTSGSGTVDSSNSEAFTLMVAGHPGNPANAPAFVRMSSEAAPVATAADVPIMAGEVRLFTNPVPFGKTGVAVICSLTTAIVYFTPGQGGQD